jgi:methenyltetrahydrofolate cyclohydrolase
MQPMSDRTVLVSGVTIGDFTAALASEHPTPGGGSAAAVAAALATALTEMVVRLSLDRPRYEQHADLHAEALQVSRDARVRFLELADEDATAYENYRDARRLPHGSESESLARDAATRSAARGASMVPLAVVQSCHRQIDVVERLAGRSNASLASDLDVAALLLEAAARGAAANVLVNLGAVEDEDFSAALTAELDQRIRQIQSATARTREHVGRGVQRRPETG